MSFRFTLQKVLEVKEHEKSEAQMAYQSAMKEFEEIATELYNLLKQKEDLIAMHDVHLKQGLPIATIQQTQETLRFLQNQIDKLQIRTHHARVKMIDKQRELTSSLVDVKKYERIKERKYLDYKHEQQMLENKFLDEISVQQFCKVR